MVELEKIEEKCKEQNLSFIGFNNDENKYINNKTKLKLKCNKCGYEWNTSSYDKFVSKTSRKCPKCSGHYKYSIEELCEIVKKRCKELDYEFLGFTDEKKPINIQSKIKLKCNKCGYIWSTTTITNLLKTERTSHTCGRNNPRVMSKTLNEEKIVNKINKKLEGTNLNFVSFDKNGYIGRKKSGCIVFCKKCGQTMRYNILTLLYHQNKCKKCEYNGKFDNNAVINEVNEKCNLLGYQFLGFNNKTNRYDGKNTRLILKCLKCGYIWRSTTYYNFINMVIKCRGCTNSWKLENEVRYILQKNHILFEEQKKFDWLKHKINLSLDFYLPEYNIFIECQGRQHFIPVDKYGGTDGFKDTKIRDKIKYQLCKEHNINPVYYTSKKYQSEFMNEQIISNEKELLQKIQNHE